MNLMTVIIIAISLSMDAFSLTLAYGTLKLSKNDYILLSIVVGVYHLIMPMIGNIIGNSILKILPISTNLIVFIVLLFIGVEMIIETFKKEQETKKMHFIEILTFGFAVSIDAFSVGIGLNVITDNIFIASLIFSIVSATFTMIGLNLGKKISNKIGSVATLLGGMTLIIIGILYII